MRGYSQNSSCKFKKKLNYIQVKDLNIEDAFPSLFHPFPCIILSWDLIAVRKATHEASAQRIFLLNFTLLQWGKGSIRSPPILMEILLPTNNNLMTSFQW
ncbi:hypothetical protein P3L10_032983 [Capsicum annuum]